MFVRAIPAEDELPQPSMILVRAIDAEDAPLFRVLCESLP
jgi:hypothetical protein